MANLATTPETDSAALRGSQKALLLLLSVDESLATPILAQLDEGDIRVLRNAAEGLEEVSPSAIALVHREFLDRAVRGMSATLKGSGAYLRRLTGQALGEHRAARIWNEENVQGPFAALSRLEPRAILALVDDESPQVAAVLLSQIDAAKASEVIELLPTDRQTDVLSRVTKLRHVPEATLREIERVVSEEIGALGDTTVREVDGLKLAAAMVKRLPQEVSEALFSELAGSDPEAADEIRQALFTFEDLQLIDRRGMQAVLKEIPTDQLLPALKTASEDLQEKIFGSLSQRAAALLRDDLEIMGPVRVSDVEAAQRAIAETALRLEREGAISIPREGGSDYV